MKDYQMPFEKLRVWQASREWIKEVYALTGAFPDAERFGLTSQLTRAAVSVAANLAEGSGRTSAKDQAHFYQMAYSSLMESACLLMLACDLHLISQDQLTNQREQIAALANQINALRKARLSQPRQLFNS